MKRIINKWQDHYTGMRFTVESDHRLTRVEQITHEMDALRLESALRNGTAPLITRTHDADEELPAYIAQGRKMRQMDPVYQGDPQRIDGRLRRMGRDGVQS